MDPSQPSPLWLQEKLRRCGLRSIDGEEHTVLVTDAADLRHRLDRADDIGAVIHDHELRRVLQVTEADAVDGIREELLGVRPRRVGTGDALPGSGRY